MGASPWDVAWLGARLGVQSRRAPLGDYCCNFGGFDSSDQAGPTGAVYLMGAGPSWPTMISTVPTYVQTTLLRLPLQVACRKVAV